MTGCLLTVEERVMRILFLLFFSVSLFLTACGRTYTPEEQEFAQHLEKPIGQAIIDMGLKDIFIVEHEPEVYRAFEVMFVDGALMC